MGFERDFANVWYRVSRDMKVHMDEQLAPSLTESQLVVLEYIMNHENVKPSDLIEYLATTPAAITTLVDRMVKNELIERIRDEEDRRIVWLHMTEKGKQEGERGLELRRQFLDSCLNRISHHNQQLLVYLLGKIAN